MCMGKNICVRVKTKINILESFNASSEILPLSGFHYLKQWADRDIKLLTSKDL